MRPTDAFYAKLGELRNIVIHDAFGYGTSKTVQEAVRGRWPRLGKQCRPKRQTLRGPLKQNESERKAPPSADLSVLPVQPSRLTSSWVENVRGAVIEFR